MLSRLFDIYVLISVEPVNACLVTSEKKVLNKLQTIQGYLRAEIAWSIKRKRVPSLKFALLKFEPVRSPEEENDYAYSENN